MLSIILLILVFSIIKGPERKKSVRINTEFARSASVPVDKVPSRPSGRSSAPNQTPTSVESE